MMSLDRGTKIYAAVLASILLIGLLTWISTLDFRLGEIDEMLQNDPEIANYPYPFRALEISGSTAFISTPRSSAVPAVKFLSIIKPGLRNKSEQDPAVIKAQKELGAIQSRVRKRILERKDINSVKWRIDKEWYANRGVWLE
jgi:hypothetical protein